MITKFKLYNEHLELTREYYDISLAANGFITYYDETNNICFYEGI